MAPHSGSLVSPSGELLNREPFSLLAQLLTELGGVNFDDYMAGGWMNQIKPLTGRGRSVLLNVTGKF
jgi:hypothetical protein